MSGLQFYSVVSTSLFVFLAVVWNRDNFINAILKIVFWLMTIAGVINILITFNFVVQSPMRLI